MKEENYAIYVHIPFCKSRCYYCDFSSCTDYNLCKKYFDKLCLEIEKAETPCKKISTIFFGGGTPSSVPTKYLDRVFDKLSSKFDLSNVVETTVECNPESVSESLIDCFKANNVNRVSMGLQSANDATLKKIGRLHNYEQFLSALKLIQSKGISNINADLIMGLPEDFSSFRQSLSCVVDLPLTHISCYALELHENTKLFSQKRLCVTDGDLLADMYEFAVEFLSKKGFERYEVSNFAKSGFECKHNLAYWTQKRYYGFGAAAAGFINNTRYTNKFDILDYVSSNETTAEAQVLSDSDLVSEYAMLGLRLSSGINKEFFTQKFHVDFYQFFPNAQKIVENQLLIDNGAYIYVPQQFFYVLNSILCQLLP